jgi:phosphate-selective porin OprO/OprP
MAGLAAGRGDNGIGVSGVAGEAGVASWVIFELGGNVASESQLADMFQFQSNSIPVQNHSWSYSYFQQLTFGVLEDAAISFSLRNRGFIQTSGTRFFGNGAVQTSAASPGVTSSVPALNNTYAIRRLQTDVNGTVYGNFDWRVHADIGGATPGPLDVSLDWRITPLFNLRIGKFKPPSGLERLISTPRAPFIENSFVAALQPNRDLGAQAFGSYGGGLAEYQAGLFNGARDNQNNTGDNNEAKDVYLRLFGHPLAGRGEWLQGLGVGASYSTGLQEQYNNTPVAGTATTAFVPQVSSGIAAYSTGRQVFFTYAPVDTSVGRVTRVSPQAYYYAGPLGVIAEYTTTSQDIRRGVHEDRLTNCAWAVTASWFLSGEKNSYGAI